MICNEWKIIKKLHSRRHKTVSQISDNYELILINDGSRDNSLLDLLKLNKQDSRVWYINFSRNFGHQIDVTSGLDASKGKAVVMMVIYKIYLSWFLIYMKNMPPKFNWITYIPSKARSPW